MRKQPIISVKERMEMANLMGNSWLGTSFYNGYYKMVLIQSVVNRYCSGSDDYKELQILLSEPADSLKASRIRFTPSSKSCNSPTEQLVMHTNTLNGALNRFVGRVNRLSEVSGSGFYVSGAIVSGAIDLSLNRLT